VAHVEPGVMFLVVCLVSMSNVDLMVLCVVQELASLYGRGERSVKESAQLVGLRLPEEK